MKLIRVIGKPNSSALLVGKTHVETNSVQLKLFFLLQVVYWNPLSYLSSRTLP